MVLNINKDKQEISLGMKQTQPNPWDQVAEQVPAGHDGRRHGPQPHQLRRLHRDRGRHRRPAARQRHELDPQGRPSQRGASRRASKVTCSVLNVDQERKRIALGLKQLDDDPWEDDIPGRYQPGDVVKGKVTKLTNFGVFVELEPGLEGLLHISELADHKVESPEEVVKVGDEIEVKILRVDRGDRKIGLSRKKAQWTKPGEEEGEAEGGRVRPRPPRRPRSSRAASAAAARSSAWAAASRRIHRVTRALAGDGRHVGVRVQ